MFTAVSLRTGELRCSYWEQKDGRNRLSVVEGTELESGWESLKNSLEIVNITEQFYESNKAPLLEKLYMSS